MDLDRHLAAQSRQFYEINARPMGLSLDSRAMDEEHTQVVRDWLADPDSGDLETFAGEHPYEWLGTYGEFGDLGMFAGVAIAATAFEYMALKRDGADAERLALARDRAVRAARSWHVSYVVTGGGGVVARGIRRIVPEDPSDPPIPLDQRELVPLADEDGNPLPFPKNNGVYREDNSGGVLPEGTWVWKDACSKDQLVGQIFALVLLYDALVDDPDVPADVITDMREDATLVGHMLMEEWDVQTGIAKDFGESFFGTGVYDLVIRDADGRPTYFHDVNPHALERLYLDKDDVEFNTFNLLMAIGIVSGLHHVSGDDAIEAYLYETMLAERSYLDMVNRTAAEGALDALYAGTQTNYSNVNMIATALWLGLYTQSDPAVRAELDSYLRDRWWSPEDEPQAASRSLMPFYSAVFLALAGDDLPGLRDETRDLLLAFDLGPYENPARFNCDEDELAADECLAVDGTTTLTIIGTDRKGKPVSGVALHPSIRAPSNFDARSNPFRVNGGGGLRFNPGGDLLASYWILRWAQIGEPLVSQHAREHMPVGGWPGGVKPTETPDEAPSEADASTSPAHEDADEDVDEGEADDATAGPTPDGDPPEADTSPASSSGGCAGGPAAPPALLLGIALWLRRRRRGSR